MKMKRKLLFGFLILTITWGNAQFQTIDDPAFEDELIRLGHDTNPIRDGGISESDAEAVTFLNLSGVDTNDVIETFAGPGAGIANLTGIKAFTNLEVLWAQQNNLVELDLEGMTTLTDVRAFNNDLERINIKGLVNLDIIGLNNNSISGINVSTNTSLRQFDIVENNLLYLDISGLSNLTEMNVRNNSLLACIQVESADRATALNNNNTNFKKGNTTTFSNTCTPIYTQIPDRNFESALISNGMDTEDGIPNGLVLTADISDEFNLDLSNKGITDLTGLEAFSALEILNVSNNNLNALRLQNVSLIEIYANNTNVPGNEIFFQNLTSGESLTNVTTLELQNNNLGIASSTFSFGGVPNVQTLNVSGNNFGTLILGGQTNAITNLIASNCPNLNTLTGLSSLSQLKELTIDNSNFTTLDFSGLNVLSTLRINNNNFSSLNLKPIDGTLTTLNTTGNANLSCIEVNNTANAEAQVNWVKNAATEYRTDCSAVEPFTVTAEIQGATGSAPNFEIIEGTSFTLNFDSGATAIDGTQYSPIIEFTINGNPETEDFSFNGNVELPTTPFTVNSPGLDGTINILPIEDNLPEGAETYTITISSPDPSLFTMTGTTSFEVIVRDKIVNPDVKQVSVRLKDIQTDIIIDSPYIITEGENDLYFDFDVLNATSTEFPNYNVSISTRDASAVANSDYSTINETVTIETRDTRSDYFNIYDAELNAKNDEELDEVDERFFVDLTPANNSIALVDYSTNPEGDVLSPGETLTIEVTIKNSKKYYGYEPIIFETEVKGNFEIIDGVYNVNEGETLRLEFNAQTPNIADGFEIYIPFEIYTNSTADLDYELNFENTIPVLVDNSKIPDNFLEIKIKNDSYFEEAEFLELILKSNKYDTGGIDFEDIQQYPELYEYQILIKINNVERTASIQAELNNTGSTEGNGIQMGRDGANEDGMGMDTFTLNLKNNDGTPYITNQDLVFDLNFDLDNNSPEESRAVKNVDYIVPEPSQIKILQGTSTGYITVQVPQEIEDNNYHEYYLVTVEPPTPSIQIDLPQPLSAKIIDDEGKFNVYYSLDENNLTVADGPGKGCCVYNQIEEGEAVKFSFKAEKGVVLDTEYKIGVKYSRANHPESSSPATKGVDQDYYNTAIYDIVTEGDDEIEVVTSSVSANDSDYNLSIQTNNNGDVEEAFRIYLEAYSENFNLLSTKWFDDDFEIITTVQASIKIDGNQNIAKESPITNAMATIELDKYSYLAELKVFYSLIEPEIDNASYGEQKDYTIDNYDEESNRGFVTFVDGATTADIIVIPKNDNVVENTEYFKINLIDEKGYSINSIEKEVQISIESEDIATYTATIIAGSDNQSSESQPDDFAEVIIELNEIPTNEVEVYFKISDRTKQDEVIEGEGQDYLIYQEDKSTIITPNERKVVFKANTDKKKSIFIKALLDTVDEDSESLFLVLNNGTNYEDISTTEAEIILISATTNLNTFDPSSIAVITNKPRCPGEDQKGSIEITNASGFYFKVNIKGIDNNEEQNLELGKNDTEDFRKQSKELSLGSYEVTLTFDEDKNTSIPENAFAPKYIIDISELEGMTMEEQGINLNGKIGEFIVSGSTTYQVKINNNSFIYSFENSEKKTIKVPLENGINSIEVKGEAACLGVISKEILLNDIFIYPNPSENIVTILSPVLMDSHEIYLFDANGKLVFKATGANVTNRMNLNISNLQKGMYLGRIVTDNNNKIEFKLLKK